MIRLKEETTVKKNAEMEYWSAVRFAILEMMMDAIKAVRNQILVTFVLEDLTHQNQSVNLS